MQCAARITSTLIGNQSWHRARLWQTMQSRNYVMWILFTVHFVMFIDNLNTSGTPSISNLSISTTWIQRPIACDSPSDRCSLLWGLNATARIIVTASVLLETTRQKILWFPPTSPLVEVVVVGWFCGVASTCSAILAAISACTHCIWRNSGIRREALHQIKLSVAKNFAYFFWLSAV